MRLSVSKIKTFKSCRRKYQLHYLEGLFPVHTPDALETGKNYHELLEHLNNVGTLDDLNNNFSKEMAMAKAYEKYIYPNFKVVEAEKWIEYDLGDGDTLVGIVDALAEDGCIVEHKSTGQEITEAYEYNLLWDEQILAYMLMTGKRKVHYTVCRKPTIRLKKGESDEEFYERMIAWYDEDTDAKIRLLEIERTDEEVQNFKIELINILWEMVVAERRNTGDIVHKPFYRNTCHCNSWGHRCEYSSICLHYDPNLNYIDFVKGEGDYERPADVDF